jgi:hypothetical protein
MSVALHGKQAQEATVLIDPPLPLNHWHQGKQVHYESCILYFNYERFQLSQYCSQVDLCVIPIRKMLFWL